MENKKVLFVDDDSAYLWKLVNAVSPLGFECRVTSDSREAVKLLSREEFDVLVTDIAMPELNGYEVIHELRSHNPGAFVIAISGQNDESVESRALERGANAFFSKPLDLENFIGVLAILFDGNSKNGDIAP